MARKLIAATVQMDATPSLTPLRLERANALVAEASNAGAQIVVLPELFNTGYTYSENNYARAESMNGETVAWMKKAAADYKVHVAGTLLLIDGDHVYNSGLLVAPDGRVWRYDKNYPWGWERAYYREGRAITVADTDLGKLGMMICWDHTHPELWQRYVGRVDAMVIMSCPPTVDTLRLIDQNGQQVAASNRSTFYQGGDAPFGKDMDAQAEWMGVPLIHSTGAGELVTKIPSPFLSVFGVLLENPRLMHLVTDAPSLKIQTGYHMQAKVVDSQGGIVNRVIGDGDAFAIGEINLADEMPQPDTPQPDLPYTPLAYLYSDIVLPMITTPLYRQGYRQRFGEPFAPVDPSTKVWGVAVLVALGIGYLFGRLRQR